MSPALRVADLRPVASPDEGIKLVVTLANEGEVALRTVVQMFVRVADGTVLGTTLEAAPSLLLPGTAGDMRYNFSHSLPPGDHGIVAEVYYGGSEQMTHESTFKMGAGGPEIVIEPGKGIEPTVAAAPGPSDTTGSGQGPTGQADEDGGLNWTYIAVPTVVLAFAVTAWAYNRRQRPGSEPAGRQSGTRNRRRRRRP